MNIQSLVYEEEIKDAQKQRYIVYCCVPCFGEMEPMIAYREINGYRSVRTKRFTGWKEPSLIFINLDEQPVKQLVLWEGV